jgi:hypothetical protein
MPRSTVGDDVRGVYQLLRALRPVASLLLLVRLPRCVEVRVVPRPLLALRPLLRPVVAPERPTRPRCPVVARPVERPDWVRTSCVDRPTAPRDEAVRDVVPRP